MRIEKQTQMSSLQGGMPPSCPHVLPPSCPVVSPRRRRLPKADAHLGTAATPSSAWNRGGCSRTPRGCVPVPGAVGWQAARTLPFPSRAACSPLETATYETGGMEVIYHGQGTWPYPWGAVIMMDWAKRPMLWPVKFILIVLMWYAQSRIVKFHSEIMEWNLTLLYRVLLQCLLILQNVICKEWSPCKPFCQLCGKNRFSRFLLSVIKTIHRLFFLRKKNMSFPRYVPEIL